MQDIDTIILTNTRDLSFYGLTQRTINTLISSEQDYKFNINVVETNINAVKDNFIYSNCNVIIPNEEFNYNKFLNKGLKHCESEWVAICNNDLIFTPFWFTNMMKFHAKYPDVKSFSPFEPTWHAHRNLSAEEEAHYGYRTCFEIAGWCLVIHRDILSTCDLFDERFAFWYQDDDYAETIKQNNFKHALVCSSKVHHVVSASHHLIEDKEKMTSGQQSIFDSKWRVNKS